ncbi:TrbC/VirB2 family protein [Candidatus Woesearchaeota archaeon]|nr:TrbC/VirB2 family protein [Candidatus Woesearchaeota archaeon]
MNKTLALFSLMLLAAAIIPVAHAATLPELDTTLTQAEKDDFNQILSPVQKIYKFVRYAASILGGIMLLGAGIIYMTSGSDPKKRDNAKGVATYVLIGLVIIWGAPLAVSALIT